MGICTKNNDLIVEYNVTCYGVLSMGIFFSAQPSEDFCGRLMSRIAHYEKRRAQRMMCVTGALLLLASVALIPAVVYTAQELSQSGFWQYFLLVFSDSGVVARSWREFVSSLIETAPVFGFTLVLLSMFVFLVSIKSFVHHFFATRHAYDY